MILLAGPQAQSGSPYPGLIMFALLGAGMYFLVLRPQRRRVRAVAAAQAGIEPGRQVMLSSGIYGTVVRVEENRLGVEIAPGVEITVARGAVAELVGVPAQTLADDDPGAPLL